MAETGRVALSLPWRDRVRIIVAVAFALAASLHFTATEAEMKLIPQWLPWHRGLVYVSGVAELLGAVGLLIPRTRRIAACGLTALLIAVFPANLNHALQNIQLGSFMDSRVYQWGRLPLQPLFIAIVQWCVGYRDRR